MGSVGSGNGVGVGVGSGSCRMQSPDGFSMEPGMKYSLTVFGQYGLALLPESLQMVIVSIRWADQNQVAPAPRGSCSWRPAKCEWHWCGRRKESG